MSRGKTIRQEQIIFFREEAKRCRADHQKIEFFNSFQEAFFIDSRDEPMSIKENFPKDLDDAFYVYANMKKLNEKEFEELIKLKWQDYPRIFKIFLFDFCILNGASFS